MPPTIPMSQLLSKFAQRGAKGSKEEREAKIDTLVALNRKKTLADDPYKRERPQPLLSRLVGLKIPVRNNVKMAPVDTEDRERLIKEVKKLSWGEVLRAGDKRVKR